MDKVNEAIMHYNREKYITKELLLGVENETPGSISNDIVLSTLDDRPIVDEKIYKHLLGIQLTQIKDEMNEDKD